MSDIYLSLTETPAVVTLSQPVAATQVAATVTVGNTVTVALDANSLAALENVTVTVGSSVALAAGSAQVGSVTVANFPASQTVAGTVTVGNFPATQTIAGTVTANVGSTVEVSSVAACGNIQDGEGLVFGLDRDFPISGTVTVGAFSTVSIGNGALMAGGRRSGAVEPLSLDAATGYLQTKVESLPAISGTVTANNPNGALTTRFGSVVTANLAFITSAVTNTSRKYLLAQNISAGTVTIGIGFSPTTTQGIQLSAGGGLTFDAFCPTGAIFWLGAVTGAAFTILEG